jgi:hypothetical protein
MRTTDHLRSTISLAAGLLCIAGLCACDSTRTPTSPAPTSSSTSPPPVPSAPVAPTSLRYQVSGRVTDEMGTRLAGVFVEVHYRPDRPNGGPSTPSSKCDWDGCFLNVLTDADGFFEVELNAESDPRLPGAFGYIHASSAGYQGDVQILPTGGTPITKNLRMLPVRRIDAGESTTVSLAADSPLCWPNDEDLFDFTRRCEMVHVTARTAGTLVVDARAANGVVPYIFLGASGLYLGPPISTVPGTVSVPVPAGTTTVSIAVPSGTAQKFDVITSLR